jgi:hypothetical protein
MGRKRAVEEEFVVKGDEVRHVPTNARFYAYAGREDIHQHQVGHMGSVLPNGDDYEEDSIWAIARRLMKEGMKKRG